MGCVPTLQRVLYKWPIPLSSAQFRTWATQVWQPKSKSMKLTTVSLDYRGAKCAKVQEAPRVYLMALGTKLHGTGNL